MIENATTELQTVLESILAFHRKDNRKISRYFKKSQKGARGIERLEHFGVPIPDDFRALYASYDEAQPNVMRHDAMAVFGEFEWYSTRTLLDGNTILRIRPQLPITDRLFAFRGDRALGLYLAPDLEKNGKCPLVASISALSREIFVAFDSTLDFLKTVNAAHRDGAIKSVDDSTVVDKRAFAEIVKDFNERDEFWEAYSRDEIDWKFIPYTEEELLASVTPEIGRIISRAFLDDDDDA